MKQTMRLQALLCLILFAAPVGAAQDIMFWNVENYFENGPHFRDKTRGIAKTILALADSSGSPPSVVGLCEIENEECMKALVRNPALRKYGYRYVHYDSPDHRGIDCALLWRSGDGSPRGVCPGLGRLRASATVPVRDTSGVVLPTRSLLVVEFDSLTVVVCHLPSKRGGTSEASRRRILALQVLSSLCDSLADHIVVLGDFNDTRSDLSDSLMAPMRELPADSGTIKFQGEWEQIDRAFVSPGLEATLRVAALPFLQEPDKKYGGVKPRRTFSGPRYLGGLSDHNPIILSFGRRRR